VAFNTAPSLMISVGLPSSKASNQGTVGKKNEKMRHKVAHFFD
jgi:hypothetical protein